MNIQEYVKAALITETIKFPEIHERITGSKLENADNEMLRMLHAESGMTTEVGEFVDQLKKHLFYGKELDWVNLGEELGDILWYVAIASDVIEKKTGKNLEHWLNVNVDKLKARYPEGFTDSNAIERNLDVEREILEKK